MISVLKPLQYDESHRGVVGSWCGRGGMVVVTVVRESIDVMI